MDTEEQRQRRRDDLRLTESGDARSEQLLVMPTELLLTNGEWLPGELLILISDLYISPALPTAAAVPSGACTSQMVTLRFKAFWPALAWVRELYVITTA